jgi:hypothetical protein
MISTNIVRDAVLEGQKNTVWDGVLAQLYLDALCEACLLTDDHVLKRRARRACDLEVFIIRVLRQSG